MKDLVNETIFYNECTLIGCLLFGVSILTLWLSFSSSAIASDFLKLTIGRSPKNKSIMRKYALFGMFLALATLSWGFQGRFGKVNNKNNGRSDNNTETYKKCSYPNREGYCACRTFDRASIWAVVKNGAEMHRVEFPKEWNVVSVGVFENGQAEVVGRNAQNRNRVIGFLTIKGEIVKEEE